MLSYPRGVDGKHLDLIPVYIPAREEFRANPARFSLDDITQRTREPNNMWPTVEIDDNGIFIETHVDEFVTVDLAMYVAEERKRIAGKTRKPLLVVFEKMVGFQPETRNYTEQILENVSALAFYVNCDTEEGLRAKQVIESFYRLTPYPVPVKVFDSKTQAIEWLKSFLPKTTDPEQATRQ